MVVTNQMKNQHLLWRAGFGPMAEDLGQLATVSQKSLLKIILSNSKKEPASIDVAGNALEGLSKGADEISMQKREFSADEKKQLRKQSREDIKSLNLAWLYEMVDGSGQLREKLSLFWHGHFASRNFNIYYQQLLLDTIRRNALGNFGDLLREVSKSAAMINFLNSNQNKKDHPNENFAREVMELFTLGRGHYSEQDVKESARAFTGWGADLRGEFVFRKFQHDQGTKTVLGKTGNLDGDDVLNILLEQKQTARFISKKMLRFFVNDEPDEQHAAWLGERFYDSNYDIGKLMEDIFNASWFYEPVNIGARIKSPIELIAGIRRMLPMKIENEASLLLIQRLLGQLLFNPPNVAGWPGGKNWIDSSTLMLRLRLPQLIYEASQFQLTPKDDDDQMMGQNDINAVMMKRQGKINGEAVHAEISWDVYLSQFGNVSREKLPGVISQALLQTPEYPDQQMLQKYTNSDSREDFIKTSTIQLMSTPEYQLC